MRNVLSKMLFIVISILGLTSFTANAGLVTQHTYAQTYQRNCPGLSNPNFLNSWKPAIQAYYGLASNEVSANLACHFNGGIQQRYYNNDGTLKQGVWVPNGVVMPDLNIPYTNAEVGDLTVISESNPTSSVLNSPNGDYYAEVVLQAGNLGLPQIKVMSTSDANERNSVNAFAAVEYLWTGSAQTLNYTLNFDFFTSGGTWDINGQGSSFHDYIFHAGVGASVGMTFDPNSVFPSNYGTVLADDGYSTTTLSLLSGSQASPVFDSVSIAFNVNPGDRFFLYGQAQAFGLNGGFTDGSHTVTSKLSVDGFDETASQAIFATSLQAAPPLDPNAIPEPSSIMLSLIGFLGLLYRRRSAA